MSVYCKCGYNLDSHHLRRPCPGCKEDLVDQVKRIQKERKRRDTARNYGGLGKPPGNFRTDARKCFESPRQKQRMCQTCCNLSERRPLSGCPECKMPHGKETLAKQSGWRRIPLEVF